MEGKISSRCLPKSSPFGENTCAHTVSLALSANLECTERLSPIISNESSTPCELGKQKGKGLEIGLWRALRLGEMRLNKGR